MKILWCRCAEIRSQVCGDVTNLRCRCTEIRSSVCAPVTNLRCRCTEIKSQVRGDVTNLRRRCTQMRRSSVCSPVTNIRCRCTEIRSQVCADRDRTKTLGDSHRQRNGVVTITWGCGLRGFYLPYTSCTLWGINITGLAGQWGSDDVTAVSRGDCWRTEDCLEPFCVLATRLHIEMDSSWFHSLDYIRGRPCQAFGFHDDTNFQSLDAWTSVPLLLSSHFSKRHKLTAKRWRGCRLQSVLCDVMTKKKRKKNNNDYSWFTLIMYCGRAVTFLGVRC